MLLLREEIEEIEILETTKNQNLTIEMMTEGLKRDLLISKWSII